MDPSSTDTESNKNINIIFYIDFNCFICRLRPAAASFESTGATVQPPNVRAQLRVKLRRKLCGDDTAPVSSPRSCHSRRRRTKEDAFGDPSTRRQHNVRLRR